MGQGYFLDSNVIIGYLAGKIPFSGMNIVSEIEKKIPKLPQIGRRKRRSDLPACGRVDESIMRT